MFVTARQSPCGATVNLRIPNSYGKAYSQDHFPILGIGQGLEMLANLADRRSSFKNCPAANLASKLTMEPGERATVTPCGDYVLMH